MRNTDGRNIGTERAFHALRFGISDRVRSRGSLNADLVPETRLECGRGIGWLTRVAPRSSNIKTMRRMVLTVSPRREELIPLVIYLENVFSLETEILVPSTSAYQLLNYLFCIAAH